MMELAGSYALGEARAYNHFGFDASGSETARRALATLDDPDGCVLLAHDGPDAVGFLCLDPSPWESDQLGARVGRVTVVVETDHELAADAARSLFIHAGGQWAAGGGGLLISRLDVGDAPAIVGAQDAGMRVLETRITSIYDHDAPYEHHHRPRGFEVRRHDGEEISTIPKDELQVLRRWVGDTDRPGHFFSDRRLSHDRVGALYLSWLERAFDGAWGDVAYTAWRDEVLVGFLSWLRAPHLEASHGLRTLVAGLGASAAPEGSGSLGDMYAAVCADRPLGTRFVEHTSQAGNAAVQTVWSRFHSMVPATAQYVLHGWFDA